MPTATATVAEPQSQTEDLCHRRHTLNPNRTFLDRCGVAAQTLMEAGVARVSRHGDPHIYGMKLFPWARKSGVRHFDSSTFISKE
jgi:hypothetical protein